MSLLQYDEPRLVDALERLPRRLRAAFAAASAERRLSAYARLSNPTGKGVLDRLHSALGCLWDDLKGNLSNARVLQEQLDSCMALLPEEEEGAPEEQVYANDAVASVIYAIRARLTGGSKEAMWAARRAYESVDHFVIARLNRTIIKRTSEPAIIAHPLVQAELQYQQADMTQLRDVAPDEEMHKGAIVELRRRARSVVI